MKKKTPKKEITLKTIIDKVESLFRVLESKIDSIKFKQQEHDDRFAIMARRSDRMEVILKRDINDLALSTTRGFDNLEENLKSKMDGLGRRIDDLSERKVDREQIRPIETRLLRMERKVGIK